MTDVQVYDNGTQTRSFQYVDDLISGLIALMASNYSHPVNLGNPRVYKIIDIAQIIRQLTGAWLMVFCIGSAVQGRNCWATAAAYVTTEQNGQNCSHNFRNFFAVKFRKDLQDLKLKLPPPLKSQNTQVVYFFLCSHGYMLHGRGYSFDSFALL